MKPNFQRLLNQILLLSMCFWSFEKYLKYMDNLEDEKGRRGENKKGRKQENES